MTRILRAAAMVVLCLGIVTVRVVWSSRGEWRRAQATDGEEQLSHLGRAARLYAPGNPYSRRALGWLAAIGRQRGPEELAAWRAARSAILATRSFYTPRRALLDEANARIAELMAAEEAPAGAPPSPRSPRSEEARAWHAARLAQDDSPLLGWTLLALGGLFGWLGCAVGFFLGAVDEQERLRPRPALAWALGIVAGLVCFFLGLARA